MRRIVAGESPESIERSYAPALRAFRDRRAKALLYRD